MRVKIHFTAYFIAGVILAILIAVLIAKGTGQMKGFAATAFDYWATVGLSVFLSIRILRAIHHRVHRKRYNMKQVLH